MGLFSSARQPHTRCALRCTAAGRQRGGSGGDGSGVEGTGRGGQGRAGQGRAGQGRAGQGRAGQGRAGQGRVPDCLIRWTFTGRDFIPLNTPVERAAA